VRYVGVILFFLLCIGFVHAMEVEGDLAVREPAHSIMSLTQSHRDFLEFTSGSHGFFLHRQGELYFINAGPQQEDAAVIDSCVLSDDDQLLAGVAHGRAKKSSVVWVATVTGAIEDGIPLIRFAKQIEYDEPKPAAVYMPISMKSVSFFQLARPAQVTLLSRDSWPTAGIEVESPFHNGDDHGLTHALVFSAEDPQGENQHGIDLIRANEMAKICCCSRGFAGKPWVSKGEEATVYNCGIPIRVPEDERVNLVGDCNDCKWSEFTKISPLVTVTYPRLVERCGNRFPKLWHVGLWWIIKHCEQIDAHIRAAHEQPRQGEVSTRKRAHSAPSSRKIGEKKARKE